MDMTDGIPPAKIAAERLNNAQDNLARAVQLSVPLSVGERLQVAGVQAQMAQAAALLDVAAAIRESNNVPAYGDC